MRIAVEDAPAEELAEGRLDDVPGHPLGVVAHAPGEVGDLDPLDEVEGQHRGGGEGLVNARHHHEGEIAGRGRHVAGVPGLVREVELLVDGAVELLDDVGGRVDPGLLDEGLEETGHVGEQPEIALELGANARALHLDRDVHAFVGPGAMHLGDGRTGGGNGVEPVEGLVDAAPQPLLDGQADLRHGDGLAGVLQLGQLGDPPRGQDVGPAGEELAQLHVGRTQVHEHLPEPGRVPAVRGGRGGRGNLRGGRAWGGRPEPHPLQVRAEAVPGDDGRHLAQAVQVVDGLAKHPGMLAPGLRTRHAAGPAC